MANSNNDWSQFYNNQTFFTTATASTVTTTTTTTATSAESPLNPETRRVAKPTRRRSRVSRRTPTTLLNTDTANFRAMVQQFTGGPSAVAFGSSSSSGFSLTSSDPSAGAPSIGYQAPWQYASLQNQTAHHHELPQQERPYMFSSSNNVSTLSYPNAVVSNGFVAADESRDGGEEGGGYAPSSERSNNVASWLQ
ncbi:PREDICTED: VQ motif-containing protein 22 [Camelina sativa]|uniref:VQ motif-containing protein 22 n=1 Tax=Camelina sativa TaxID=90675 RepID=A0ABM0UFC9_CAMSA|nr:PREDICTED: VQ motif-containing protein 22 [Camelina sativa]